MRLEAEDGVRAEKMSLLGFAPLQAIRGGGDLTVAFARGASGLVGAMAIWEDADVQDGCASSDRVQEVLGVLEITGRWWGPESLGKSLAVVRNTTGEHWEVAVATRQLEGQLGGWRLGGWSKPRWPRCREGSIEAAKGMFGEAAQAAMQKAIGSDE